MEVTLMRSSRMSTVPANAYAAVDGEAIRYRNSERATASSPRRILGLGRMLHARDSKIRQFIVKQWTAIEQRIATPAPKGQPFEDLSKRARWTG